MSLVAHSNYIDVKDLFQRCREAVSAEEAARYYGLDIKAHKAKCPFHDDRTPSLYFFKDGCFRCFGCGTYGDSITFTAQYLGLRPIDALRRLDTDFALHLPFDRPRTAQEARQRAAEVEVRKVFQEWNERTLTELSAAYRVGHQALMADRDLTEQEAYAVRNMARIEHLLDVLSSKDMIGKYSIFMQWQEVDKLCQTILQTISS